MSDYACPACSTNEHTKNAHVSSREARKVAKRMMHQQRYADARAWTAVADVLAMKEARK